MVQYIHFWAMSFILCFLLYKIVFYCHCELKPLCSLLYTDSEPVVCLQWELLLLFVWWLLTICCRSKWKIRLHLFVSVAAAWVVTFTKPDSEVFIHFSIVSICPFPTITHDIIIIYCPEVVLVVFISSATLLFFFYNSGCPFEEPTKSTAL